MKNTCILGNGITGITAARHLRKHSDAPITVISAETDHFYSRTALMYIYMGHMKYKHTKPYEDWFWEKNRINLKRGYVERIDFLQKTLHFKGGETMNYDQLVLATGSKPNKFGWPGQDLDGVSGLYSYQDLEAMETYTRDIRRGVVVGGGLIGIEMAEMMASRKIPVTFLVRESSFWNNVLPPEESDLINRHIRQHHIDLRLGTELKEIIPDEEGRASKVVTSTGEEIEAQFVGLTAGVSPNIGFLKNTDLETNRGILVNEFLETNLPDVYAAGDCAEFRTPYPNRRPIEQVWYTGRMMGEVLGRTLAGEKTAYKPGIWFNSAKFFDIEYQTYGHVWAQLKPDEQQFYWEHSEGDKCIKFVFAEDDHRILGINTFGIRLRHENFNQWIEEKATISHVMEHLREANFDPEFFKRFEDEIIEQFNTEYPALAVSLKPKSFFAKIFS